ncbi:MAG TPA: M13 family metallopeptidase [Rudaea sp.]|nr:M13 family metallopeptidase [Rudaea sp.]
MIRSLLKPLVLGISLAIASTATVAATASSDSSLNPAQFDQHISPCQNLYDFVNTNWIKAHPIPADRSTYGIFALLQEKSLATQRAIVENAAKSGPAAGTIEQKIGDLYATGMNVAAINKAGYAPISDDLKRIDGLRTPDEIANFVSDYAASGFGFLFDFSAEADFHNSRQMIAYASQAGLGLPERDYYFKTDATSKKIRAAYINHVQRSLELVGASKSDAARQAKQVMAMETRLAGASLPIVELRDPANQYHHVDFATADATTPHFAWEKFFASQNISGEKGFSLSQPKFFAEMDKLLATASAEQWRAYFRFHLVNTTQPYLSKPFVNEHFDFYSRLLEGQKKQRSRWKEVLDTINEQLGMALGQLYVAQTFPPEAKQRARQLVDNLRAALKQRIEKLDWMSEQTKAKAIEKWNTFVPKVGYPDKWRDWSGLNIDAGSYFGNVRAALKFNHDWEMAKIGKPVDRSEWGMTPQTINAYYNPFQNEIVFPAAILQPPFFDASADDALNYGGIGAGIGHEMTHGYDDEGSQFDAHGNLKNWWTPADKKQFDARTDKLVRQFDAYVAIDGMHVHGKQTLGENIADLGGLNVAYDALQKALAGNPSEANKMIDGYTQDQRFFLNFARIWVTEMKPETLKLRINTDVHAPGQFRAIAAPSNMPAFAKAFSCKAGDPMVRADDVRVKIW